MSDMIETTIKTRVIYYSASTGGFYFSDENATIPADAVAVSETTYNTLLTQQAAGYEIHPDANGNPINAPTKPAYATGWDATTASWTIDTDAKAAAEAAATAKATQLATLKTTFATYVTTLNTKYTGLNLDPDSDTEETALTKCMACTASDGTTGMSATDCSALEWYWNKLQSLAS